MKRILPEILSIASLLSTSFIAVFVSWYLKASGNAPETSGAASILYIIYFLVATLGFTAFVLILARKKRLRLVRIIFIISSAYILFFIFLVFGNVSYSILYSLYSYIGVEKSLLALNVASVASYVVWILPPAFIMYSWIRHGKWYMTNITGILVSAGLASLWGLLLNVWYSVFLLAIFAVYDYISVYRTGHMVTLAKAAVDDKLPMLFVFPPSLSFDAGELRWDGRGESNVMMLGFGDVALPSILIASSSSYGLHLSPLFLILPLIGAVGGMIALLSGRIRKPAPGLPLINGGAIIGFLAAYLLVSPFT